MKRANSMSLFVGLIQKFQTEIRFLIVGAWNTLFGIIVFILLLNFLERVLINERLIYLLSIFLSHFIAVLNAYIFHKFFTFQSKEKGIAALHEFRRFSSSYLGTLILNLVIISFMVEFFEMQPEISGAISIPICVVITYFLLSKYSFKKAVKEQ